LRAAQARYLLALEGHPDYDDVRLHLARLWAWDGRYDEARAEVRYILERRPGNLEAREAALDVEVWSDHPHEALRLCAEGLALAPSAQLLYRKARILKSLEDRDGAYAAAQSALVLDPNHQGARQLRDDLKELLRRSKVALDYGYETYSAAFTPWRTESLTLGHRFPLGSVLARVNRARRFDAWGTQMELEAYPRRLDGTYAYLNAGRSTDFMFPSRSAGAQLYHNFQGGIEGSLGFRYLDFSGSTVTIQVGTVGWYHGDGFYSLQLFRTPSAIGSSLSGSLKARWYFEGADSWYEVSGGTGLAPDYLAWSDQVVKIRAQHLTANLQKRLSPTQNPFCQ